MKLPNPKMTRRKFLKLTGVAILSPLVPINLHFPNNSFPISDSLKNTELPSSPSASDPTTDKWFLPHDPNTDLGWPWGDGTAMAGRKKANQNPWDENCRVTPLIGGYEAMRMMRDKLEEAITAAPNNGLFGERGLVYISDWRLNPMRDLSDQNSPWTSSLAKGNDPTILGMLLRLMYIGIQVRLLLWQPTPIAGKISPGFKSHILEHVWLSAIIHNENELLMKEQQVTKPIGIVATDSRVPALAAAHHQKMMVIRVGQVQVAFCGGVDFAFTRRDCPDENHPYDPGNPHFMAGDWQSGNQIPAPNSGWPRQLKDINYSSIDNLPFTLQKAAPTDLPDVYGATNQIWHDQHLLLEGPIVSTLEAQFGERWRNYGIPIGPYSDGDIDFSTYQAYDPKNNLIIKPLEPYPSPPPKSSGKSKVQMWRTIPIRDVGGSGLFQRGEFTVMAGIANACKNADELIWIFDQYFWSQSLARLLNRQIRQKPDLHILIILPPHADTFSSSAHHARRLAIDRLLSGLFVADIERIGIFDLWHPGRKQGIYCHAKVQMYDGSLLVCGSANLNRRSFTCDSELDCAVLDPDVVTNHQKRLWELLFPTSSNWPISGTLNDKGNGKIFFERFMALAPLPNNKIGGGPKEDVYLISDPWLPGAYHQLPTDNHIILEEDSFEPTYESFCDNFMDPNYANIKVNGDREPLDEWSNKLEKRKLK